MNGAPTAPGEGRRRGCARALRLVASAGSIATLLGAFGALPAMAQSSPRPAITVAATIPAEPASQAAFPIRVGPADAVPRNSFVRLRGLPPMAALPDGHSIAPGAWAVSLSALPSLRITLPAGATGRSDIVITLVAVDGSVLAEAKSTLAIAAARQPDKSQPKLDGAPPPAASILRAGVPLQAPPAAAGSSGPVPRFAPQAMTPQDREQALRLLKRGDAQLEDGNVSAARLLYERAADAGLAQAAMALAATFDAEEMARLELRGVPPDAKEARRWYERARQLGASDAEERLRRIGANR